MKCAWQAYLKLLPHWMREEVDKRGREALQELRLRISRPPELICATKRLFLNRNVNAEDLKFCVNAASQYSPWSAATAACGYITAAGGHRVGICGEVAIVNGKISTVSNITSLCVRVARDLPGIGEAAAEIENSMLIIGRPGSGKTTLLRDLIRQKSNLGQGAVAVVDERRELFPVAAGDFCFQPGMATEVISGCNKRDGMEILIRTMNPSWLAVDEVTGKEDCEALLGAVWCGVRLMATAHGNGIRDFQSRTVYKPLRESGLFQHIIVMQPDKSWRLERMNI